MASFYVLIYVGTALPIIGVGVLANTLGLFTAVQIFAVSAIAMSLAGLVALTTELRHRAG